MEDQESVYLLLEYCKDGEVYGYLKEKGCLDEDEARSFALQMAQALKYLHDRNIIHRDLKLGNILLAPSSKDYVLVNHHLSVPFLLNNIPCRKFVISGLR